MLKTKNEELTDKLYKLDQQAKITIKERDRLRSKIIRMKNQQKVAFSVNKTCVNCKIDYRESENFNWSCRTHPSDWGGTVWWCCGKTDPNHQGCKFGKHISKEEQDQELEQDAEDEKERVKKGLLTTRCYCCKQKGHLTEHCQLDPNLKTKTDDPDADCQRVLNSINFAKKHMESNVQVTHLLKKSVMLPTEGETKPTKRSQSQPFQRGIMSFDDYSYRAFNDFVLVKDPKNHTQRLIEIEARLNKTGLEGNPTAG